MNSADQAFASYQNSRDPEDLARVFDACAPKLLLLANHVVGDGTVAEDLVQLTFLRAIEIADKYDASRPVMSWLVGILLNEGRRVKRESRRKPDAARVHVPGGESIPGEVAQLEEFRAEISKALDQLPQAYREVLMLRLIHGLTPTEIAHLRGVSAQTIKTQLRRGTERLRQLLPASLATAVMAMSMVGGGLAFVREHVLEAASGTVAGTVATVGVAATLAGVATGTTTAGAVTVTAASATGAVVAKNVVLVAGFAAIATAGWFVLDPFGDAPHDPLPEVREVLPEKTPKRLPIRVASAKEEAAVPAPKPIDPNLIAFHGRVLGDTNLGLQGITVDLVRFHPELLAVPAAGLPATVEQPRFLVGSVSTDERGKFAFDAVQPSGAFLLMIEAPDGRSEVRYVRGTPTPKKHVDLGWIRLARKRLVRGRIVDPNGFPVKGARLLPVGQEWLPTAGLGVVGKVLAATADDEFDPNGVLLARCANHYQALNVPGWFRVLFNRVRGDAVVTDESGRFEWLTTRSGSAAFVVTAAGFARRRLTIEIRGENSDVGQFKMAPVGRVGFLVRDGHGDPVAGAQLAVAPAHLDEPVLRSRPLIETDDDGEAELHWDRSEMAVVAVRAGDNEPWSVHGPIPLASRTPIALPQTFDVEIRAVHREGSAIVPLEIEPIVRLLPARFTPQVSISMLTMHQLGCVDGLDLRRRRRVETPGVLQIRRVPKGSYTLLATAKGYASTAMAVEVDGAERVRVELRPLHTTAIALTDPMMRSLPDQAIFARAAVEFDRVHEFPVRVGVTDEHGALDIERSGLRRYSITAMSSEFGCANVLAGSGVDVLRVTMTGRGGLSGRLFQGEVPGPDGEWLVVANPKPFAEDPVSALPMSQIVAPVAADGRFVMPPLEPGRWALRGIRVPAQPTHLSLMFPVLFPSQKEKESKVDDTRVEVFARSHQQVRVRVDVPAVDEPVAKEPEPEKNTLHGRVTVRPWPVGGVCLGYLHQGRPRFLALSASGEFDTGVPWSGGQVVVTRRHSGELETSYLWAGPSQSNLALDLQLMPNSFTLSTDDRRAARGVDIAVTGQMAGAVPGRFKTRTRTDSGGWIRVDLPRGNYTLVAEHAAFGWLDQKVAVGTASAHSFRFNPLVAASGRAIARAIGVDLPRGSVVEFTRVGGAVPIFKTGGIDSRGRFTVSGLLPGKYSVVVRPARIVGGRILRRSSANRRIPQGQIEIGTAGRMGLELRRPQ